MKIGDRVFVHGYVDEIRKDTVIIRNNGGYFGTIPSEIIKGDLVRCKDCKYFEYDHVEKLDGIPLIVAHEICTRWSDGVKTSENGYCFLGEVGDSDDSTGSD